MNRADKTTLLSQLLQGKMDRLQILKQEQSLISGVVIVDRMPDECSNEPVQASYTLNNGTKVTEQFTYAQMLEKAGEILIILPDNYR